MSWITVVWSMNGAACLTLAAFYFAIWCKQRENWVYLLFSCSAIAAAAISAFELGMMNAQTVERYQALVRWIHVPAFVLTLSFVAFVRLYLHAGRAWLAWSIYGVRTLVLILNFIFPVSINFQAITDIRHFSWAGEIVSVPVGLPNPWGLISQVSLLLLLIFSVDATITVWRRGDRRRAFLVGGSLIFGAILAWHVPLVIWGVIKIPFFLGFTYTAVVAAMGYELSSDMARAAHLARELELSDKRLNLAADSADLGLWEWDLTKDEIWVTPTRRAQLGFPVSGRITFEDLISRWHADDRDKVRQALRSVIENGKDYNAEFRGVHADGSVRWVAARGRVQVNKRGKPVRLLGVSMDITARKQAELEAARQRHDLAHLARVTMLGELSSSLAHELTHPITAILSNAQAAQRFLDGDNVDLNEVREILHDIVTEDQRAGDVIHRLRRLLRKGEPPKHGDDVDLKAVIGDVLKIMRSDLINQNVTVETDLAQNLPSVRGDQVQLQQVVLNLVMNGCEAMADCDSSERQLLIASKSENGAVVISVTDRGGGIHEKKLEQVFERFFTTKKEGMGLGLSICRTIIDAHRGKIWATNNADRGATFHFSLAIVRSDGLSATSSKVLDRSALTATDASAPRVAPPSVLLTSAATGSEAEELWVGESSVLFERRQ
jgi:two-component system, LuxR family, sensor kinase FixL